MKKLFFFIFVNLIYINLYSQIIHSIKVNGEDKDIIILSKNDKLPDNSIPKGKIKTNRPGYNNDDGFIAQFNRLIKDAIKIGANIIQLQKVDGSEKQGYFFKAEAFYNNTLNTYKEYLIKTNKAERCKNKSFSYINIYCNPIRVQFSKYNYNIKINNKSYHIHRDTLFSIKIENEGYVDFIVDELSSRNSLFVKLGNEYYVECIGKYDMPLGMAPAPNTVKFVIPNKNKCSVIINSIENELQGEIEFNLIKDRIKQK